MDFIFRHFNEQLKNYEHIHRYNSKIHTDRDSTHKYAHECLAQFFNSFPNLP